MGKPLKVAGLLVESARNDDPTTARRKLYEPKQPKYSMVAALDQNWKVVKYGTVGTGHGTNWTAAQREL